MIASAALSLFLACAPRAAAAAAVEPAALATMRAAPLPLLPAIVQPVLSAALPGASASLAAPVPAAPALAAGPAPELRAAPGLVPAEAAADAEAPSARLSLSRSALAPEAAAASFDGRASALDPSPTAAPAEGPSTTRLQLLSAVELGVAAAPETPRSPSSDPKPFLYRHYGLARAVALPLLRLVYGIRVEGHAALPPGPALIVPNHVSWLDPVLVSYAANRPMRFVVYRPIYETYGLQWLFRSLGAIPISHKDPKDVIEESLNRARRALAAGETVVMFPEGQVTRDGDFGVYRRGFERVAAGLGVPVVPAYIDGMWGSALSRHPRKSLRRSLLAHLRGRRPAAVSFGPPLERADAALAREAAVRLAEPRPAPLD